MLTYESIAKVQTKKSCGFPPLKKLVPKAEINHDGQSCKEYIFYMKFILGKKSII